MKRTKEAGTPSAEQRQTDVDSLIFSIQGNPLAEQAASQGVRSMRQAIAKAPLPIAAGLCRDLLAVHGVMLAGLLREVSRPGEGIVTDVGTPHPVLLKHLPAIQKNIFAAAAMLQKLEGGGSRPEKSKTAGKSKGRGLTSGANEPLDVSTLVLELTQIQNHGDSNAKSRNKHSQR